ncbi:MAG: (d)CMP kinase [Gammaproteobacteria bacterium]|nr:(d)CMP kinase [Gammaproteobacteria bacterium]
MAADKQVPVIAIDGPSGSGKGTVSRILAQKLGWHYLDSGALYRLVAYAAVNAGTALDSEAALAAIASSMAVVFDQSDGRVLLNGRDVSDDIRSESCGNGASQVAALPAVRQALLQWQRACRRAPGLVGDGRDMGSVVFIDAQLKIFLTASAEERARRRYKQLKEKGVNVSLGPILQGIEARDLRDSQRKTAPLVAAADAVVLDTTAMSVDAVISEIEARWAAVG